MNILFVASEADPFIKTGGLADVAGSLPLEIKKQGEDIRVVMPLYSQIPITYREKMRYIGYYYVDLSYHHKYCGVFQYEHEGVTYYFLDNEEYFTRNTLYGQDDDGERFIFFSKAVALLPKVIGFKPDIVHTNDWHSAMVNVYIKDFARGDGYYWGIKCVYTIHNLKYQGVFNRDLLTFGGISEYYFNDEALKFHESINFMKAGIVFSDAFTTVSNSYANEIKYPYFGEGLDGIIRKLDYKLTGIVNGIDYNQWNPMTDKFLVKNYDIKNFKDKKENKKEIQKRYGLPIDSSKPMIGMVSRLVEMKGLDLVSHILEELLNTEDVQVVVLGTGDYKYEEMLNYFGWKYPSKISSRIYYNNEEAHLIYAGADFLLMPSLAEPCGISQLIAMRYGTIPIVRETGGLKDTVLSYNEVDGSGTGFTFANINAHDLLHTIRRAIGFYSDKDIISNIIKEDMSQKNDWEMSSKIYLDLYNNLLN